MEVTFRREIGSAEILPTRPGIDPFEDTRPMYTASDVSYTQKSPITADSLPLRVRTPYTHPGSVPPASSYIFGLQPKISGHQPEPGSTLSHYTVDPTSLHSTNSKSCMIRPMVPFPVTANDPQPRFQGHGLIFRPIDAINALSAQLTRDRLG